jgi:hypothetical protein
LTSQARSLKGIASTENRKLIIASMVKRRM